MNSKSRNPRIARAVVEALEARRLLSLAAPASFNVGDGPVAVATGDFNGDGRSDVVTANFTSKNVSVLLATATGAMQPAQHYAAGAALAVAVGDVNNDGKLDIVTSNADAGASVLLGNGNGTFAPALAVGLPSQFPPGHTGAEPVPQWGVSVAVGDMNADGKMDLVVGGKTAHLEWRYGYYGPYQVQVVTNYVNVLLGNGTGAFASAASYRSGGANEAVSVADFNGDAKLDVLSGPFSLLVWLGNGNGTLQTPTNPGATGLAVVGDFDADGKLDLAAGYSSTVGIFKGQGNGAFQFVRDISLASPGGLGYESVRSIVTGDVDNDGKLDLVVNTQHTTYEHYGYYGGYDPTTVDRTKVLLGFGDGSFSLPITSTLRSYENYASGGNGTALGDVNADGLRDVIATEPALDIATVQLNQGGWVAPVGVQIDDVTVTEGHSGTVNAVLTVTLDHAASFAVSVPFSTADGTATVAGGDYFANSGTLSFSPGQTSKTITVQVRGDRQGELDEQLFVNLDESPSAVPLNGQGVVTITEDEPGLSLSTNTSVTEGNTGTKTLNVTATLSAAYDAPVTFTYTTQGGQARSGVDFVAATGTVTFEPGQTSKQIPVTVNGDTIPEYAESLFVVLSNVGGALWNGNYGHATIVDDDAGSAVAISNVSRAEGNSGTTPFTFTLTRLTPSEREQFVYFSTSNGSASSSGGNKDYDPVSTGAAHFSPGQVNTTVTIFVRGDTRNESDETFNVNLTSTSDGTIADAQAVGTILNDESRGKTWVGPAEGGNWSTASNWSPSGVPTATSLVTIRNASVTLSSSATVAELSLGGGSARLTVAPNGNRVLRMAALFIENGGGSDVGILDLTDNDLIVDYVGGAGNASPLGAWNGTGFGIGGTGAAGWYDGILGSVAQGYNHGEWNLAGIVTSRPDAAAGLTTLGVAEASSALGLSGSQTQVWNGQTVNATCVLVKYTFAGDANLDGKINIDDYGRIDGNVAQPDSAFGWFNGDFNYDGKINIDDYGIIDGNINRQDEVL